MCKIKKFEPYALSWKRKRVTFCKEQAIIYYIFSPPSRAFVLTPRRISEDIRMAAADKNEKLIGSSLGISDHYQNLLNNTRQLIQASNLKQK